MIESLAIPETPPASESSAPQAHHNTHSWQRAYFALYTTYIIVGIGARLLGWWYGDAIWFVWAARHVLDNSFDLYSLHLAAYIAPPAGITYSYSPLLAILVAPFVGAADALQLGDEGAYRAMAIPLIVLDVVAMQELRRLARAWRPAVDERFLFLGSAMALFLTSFLTATAYRGHVEGLVLLFLLLTLRYLPRHLVLAGVFAGLALAAKHTSAVFALLPIGLVMLTGGRTIDRETPAGSLRPQPWRRAWRDTAIWACTAGAVFAAFMVPPLLRDPGAVYYAFVTLPARLISHGPGLLSWVDQILSAVLSPVDFARVRPTLLSAANLILGVVVTVLVVVLVARARACRAPLGLVDVRLIGLIAFSLTLTLALSKWVSDHYYPLPLALIFLWDIMRCTRPGPPASIPWIGIGAAIGYRALTQIDVASFPEIGQSAQTWIGDALLFVFLTALVIWLWQHLMPRGDARHAPE